MSREAGRYFGVVRTLIGIGLIVYLALSGAIDWAGMLGLASAWRLSLAAFALMLVTVLLVSWRLRVLLAPRELDLPLAASFRLTLIGGFASNFLPGTTGGDVARIYLVARANTGRGTEIAAVVLVDRAIGLLALLVLPVAIVLAAGASIALPASAQVLVRLAALGSALLAAGFAVAALSRGALRRGLVRAAGRVGLHGHAERFFDTLYAYHERPGALAGAFLISLAIQASMVVPLLLLFRATGGDSAILPVAALVPFGMLANMLPLTPGGLGVGEAAFETLFLSVGAAGGAETILAWRILTTLIDLLGGALLVVGRTDMPLRQRLTAPLGGDPGAVEGPGEAP